MTDSEVAEYHSLFLSISSTDELGHIIYVSEAKWAVVNEKAVEKTKAAFSALGSLSLRKLWTMDGSPGTSLGDQMRLQSLDLPSMKDGFDSARVVALMPFSSGTTGFPKGVMLSHRNLVTTYASTMFVRSLNPDIKFNIYESALLFLPMYHMYGYNIMMNTFTLGGKLVLLNKFSPKKFLEAIQKYKVTFAPVVPYVMRILVETPLINQYDLSSLYGFLTGSAPVAGKTLDALSEKSGRISIQGYALTESCGTGSANRGLPGTKSNSVGYFGPFFKAKVIDVATGEMLGEMEEGELCLQGPSIMMGYANNPKATAETIDSEGWLHTGDLAYFNEEDEVFITDRMKDLIKVKGYQVSPAELEALIQKLDNVCEVAVAGVPDARLGEVPRAWIVPVPGTTIDKKAVMKHVAGNNRFH
ncbi:hypothetical protein SK128_014658 [Halocaridina rubra]|uniref:Uncharacterized protein n=1 Tax=Halocaridina rubra TaxID=373956 RepID=A0AAN8WES7_HALRR